MSKLGIDAKKYLEKRADTLDPDFLKKLAMKDIMRDRCVESLEMIMNDENMDVVRRDKAAFALYDLEFNDKELGALLSSANNT